MGPKEKLIERYRPNIEKVLSDWAFVPGSPERSIKLAEIIAWIKNFEPSEIEYAIKIMENIQYYDDHRIRGIIENLSGKIRAIFGDGLKDVLFFPLGQSSASSGSIYLYQYRKELGLSENNFKQESFNFFLDKNINIVFFDDIIGSGNQASNFFNKYLSNRAAQCYYFSLIGLEEGLCHVKNNTGFKITIAGEVLTNQEMAFSENSCVFEEKQREVIKQICEKYGNKLFKKHPLGYDNTQGLIVFPHNTPNNTLPIIWASNDNETSTAEILWKPLWNRKKVQNRKHEKTQTSTTPTSFFDGVVSRCQTFREKAASYADIQIKEEKNSESISFDIRYKNDIIFLKIARNIYFNTNNSILVWLYKNKFSFTDASFNGVVEQNSEKVRVINLGMFLSKKELDISFSSIKNFIEELFDEIGSLI